MHVTSLTDPALAENVLEAAQVQGAVDLGQSIADDVNWERFAEALYNPPAAAVVDASISVG